MAVAGCSGLSANPKNLNVLWHFAAAFVLAALLYAGLFLTDQHLRTRRGPWEVRFHATPGEDPWLTINQPSLGLTNILIEFPGERSDPVDALVRFHTPEQTIPMGQVKYEDLTYLPGVVTLEVFEHEIELLPRVLYLNRQAQPWRSNARIQLRPEDRPPAMGEPLPRKGRY
jgi:hypothetical protein